MECTMLKLIKFGRKCAIPSVKTSCMKLLRRKYTEEAVLSLEKKKIIHPYRKMHPWKSLEKFSEDMANNVIYNHDGIVALNKPYGISARPVRIDGKDEKRVLPHKIPNAVDYTLSDSLQHIAKRLNYGDLTMVKVPEKYMSGVTLLAANKKALSAITESVTYAIERNILYKTFWIVTTRVPNQLKGKQHLAMKLLHNRSSNEKKPVILTKWSNNDQKKKLIKILNVEFKVLSNSTLNLSSLIEIKTSSQRWHAIRLFASCVLFAPVLGDNYHGSRVQNVMGSWLPVDPFLPVTETLPKLNKELLNILHLTPAKQEMIPAHVHLKSFYLPRLFGPNEDVTIEAPLNKPFSWTCEKLQFKNLTNSNEEELSNVQNDSRITTESQQTVREDCWDNVQTSTAIPIIV